MPIIKYRSLNTSTHCVLSYTFLPARSSEEDSNTHQVFHGKSLYITIVQWATKRPHIHHKWFLEARTDAAWMLPGAQHPICMCLTCTVCEQNQKSASIGFYTPEAKWQLKLLRLLSLWRLKPSLGFSSQFFFIPWCCSLCFILWLSLSITNVTGMFQSHLEGSLPKIKWQNGKT